MKKGILLLFALLSSCALAKETGRAADIGRLQDAATVLHEIMDAPDKGIPEDIFSSAKCVAVVPSYLKGGFIIGASYGKGVVTCQTGHGWSAPAFFKLTGGSLGLQAGGEAVDLIMLVMNDRGVRSLWSSKFKLGANASAAAGPVGREAAGSTDWKMRAEVLTYSRARGIFAGISLSGASLTQDEMSTREFYGRFIPMRTTLRGTTPLPQDGADFVNAVSKYAGGSSATPSPTQPK